MDSHICDIYFLVSSRMLLAEFLDWLAPCLWRLFFSLLGPLIRMLNDQHQVQLRDQRRINNVHIRSDLDPDISRTIFHSKVQLCQFETMVSLGYNLQGKRVCNQSCSSAYIPSTDLHILFKAEMSAEMWLRMGFGRRFQFRNSADVFAKPYYEANSEDFMHYSPYQPHLRRNDCLQHYLLYPHFISISVG